MPVLVFSAVYYALVIFLAAYINVWEDEVYSLNTSSRDLAYAYKQSVNFEQQPPVYFLLLTLWRYVSESVLWARLFSIIIIIVAQVLLFRFIKRIADAKLAVYSSVLFLLDPATLFTILEIRVYALVILVTLALLIHFFNTYNKNDNKPGNRALFVLLAITGLFAQYYLGFILVALAIVLVYNKSYKSLKLYLFDMIIPLCLILLYIPSILSSSGMESEAFPHYNRTVRDLFGEFRILFPGRVGEYLLPFGELGLPIVIVRILQFVIFVLMVFSIKYDELKQNLREILLPIIVSVIVLAFFVLVDIKFGYYSIKFKYTTVLFVPLFIALVLFFRLIKTGWLNFWMILFVILFMASGINKYRGLYKVNNFKSLGLYLESIEKEDQAIFVYRNISVINLEYYYNGINILVPIPEAFNFDKPFGPGQWNITEEDIDKLNDLFNNYSCFHIVNDNIDLRGVEEF